ncbi:MAG: hypothetical protein ACJ76D_11430 [Solirubrobacterales bacterium]
MIGVVLVTTAACAAGMLVGGGGELVAVTMFVVGGLGVDQVSKLILSFDSPKRH